MGIENIGLRIKMLRRKQNISQTDMANAVGISISSLSNIERDYTDLTLSKLDKIATTLGVSVEYLLHEEDENSWGSKATSLKFLKYETEIRRLQSKLIETQTKLLEVMNEVINLKKPHMPVTPQRPLATQPILALEPPHDYNKTGQETDKPVAEKPATKAKRSKKENG